MNQKPLVSCIIIFLNGEEYIEESIESVFSQTYNNWELLLVDDGSTDKSTEIALHYAKQYPNKVRYLDHEGHQNRGMSAARNLGIERAKGEYIAFLDADDIWLPSKLQQQVAIFDAHPEAAMVYGRTLMWHSWTGKPEDEQRDYFFNLGVKPNTLIYPPKLLILLLENRSQKPTTCNAILRREIFDKVGRFEEIFRGMYEDQVFFAKVNLHVPVFVADECWAKYRQHPESCYSSTVENIETACTARLFFLNWMQDYLRQQAVKNPVAWLFLLKEIWFCNHPRILQRWLLFKKLVLETGQQVLPDSLRDWIWTTIGRHVSQVLPENSLSSGAEINLDAAAKSQTKP
jgi:glycosyltransferase involved in cell wall biosynthesis